MAILSVIRRWHLRDGVSIREIARRTRLSRNTIRKYLASGVVEPKYPKRKSPSKIDGFAINELPSGYRAPTVAGDNVPLEVFDEEDSESGVHAGVQARDVA